MSHPWRLSRLGSHGWSVLHLSGLGRSACNEPSTQGPGESPAQGVCVCVCVCGGGRGGGGPPAAKPSLLHPKAAGTSGMGELWKVLWSPRLLVVGIPTPASFLGVNPTTDDITLHRVELQELACVREIKVKGEEIERHNTTGLFVTQAACRWNRQSGSKACPAPPRPAPGCLSNQSWAGRNAAALWSFPITTTWKQYSLEELMLELKLQYFGHLMRRTDSLEKTLMLGKI